jgi:hypothetical protein
MSDPTGYGANETPVNALRFLQRARSEGRIVCTGELTTLQIAEARADGRMWVDDDGFGYVVLPWSLTTTKDEMRNAGIFKGGCGGSE